MRGVTPLTTWPARSNTQASRVAWKAQPREMRPSNIETGMKRTTIARVASTTQRTGNPQSLPIVYQAAVKHTSMLDLWQYRWIPEQHQAFESRNSDIDCLGRDGALTGAARRWAGIRGLVVGI